MRWYLFICLSPHDSHWSTDKAANILNITSRDYLINSSVERHCKCTINSRFSDLTNSCRSCDSLSINKKKKVSVEFSDDWYNRLRDTRTEINRVRCRMIRRVHARSQFVRSYTNVHVNRMTGSVRTRTPRDWVKVGATGNKRGKKEGLAFSLSFSWWAPLSWFFAGVPRDWIPRRPGRHRDARFRSIILTADSMISFALLPFFFSFSSHSCLVGHGCAQTTGARPPGYSEQIGEKICRRFFFRRESLLKSLESNCQMTHSRFPR